MEEDSLVMPQISDNIPNEDGAVTVTQFSVQEWLLYRKQRLNLLNLKTQLSRMEENKNDSMGSLQVLRDLFTDVVKETRRPADVEESSLRINNVVNSRRVAAGRCTTCLSSLLALYSQYRITQRQSF